MIGSCLLFLVGYKLGEQLLQGGLFFACQCGEHGFISTVKEPVAALGHEFSQTSRRKFGMAVTVAFAAMMTTGSIVFMNGFTVKIGFSFAALQIIFVAVVGAAGAFICIFHKIISFFHVMCL